MRNLQSMGGRAILIGAVLLPLVSVAFARDALVGNWTGVWIKSGDELPVDVTFEESSAGLKGWFDSDALQVAEIPFQNVKESNGRVSFDLVGDQTTTKFDGLANGNTLRGALTEASAKGTFFLRRTTKPAADEIHSEDVTFHNGSVTLAGSILSPPTRDKRPAILFLHGSGPEGRWTNGWLARKFVGRGFVALIYDKRGVGGSGGDWQNADFDTLSEDAAAGVRFLRSRPDVNPDRIVVYGHSQGGTIAPLVFMKAGGVSTLIASAANGIDAADTEIYSVENSIALSKLSPVEQGDARSYVAALVDTAYRGKDRATLDRLAGEFKTRSWYFDPPPADNYYWRFAKAIERYQPKLFWRQVKCPVLLLYGADDQRVPPNSSAAAIETALAEGGNNKITLRVFPGADHSFALTTGADGHAWPRHVPLYAETTVDWALQLSNANTSGASRQ